MATKKLSTGAQKAKNVAREARKAANPKSQRGAVKAGLMTKAEAVEQATVKRAGVQAAGRKATAGRAVERGVQERAARVTTRKAGEKAAGNMAARAAGSSLKGRVATAGKAVLGRAAAPVAAFTTGYAIGTAINEMTGLSTKIGDYYDRVTGQAKQMEQSMTTTPRGGARKAPAATAPAASKPTAAAAKPAAVKKAAPKAAPKTSTYGDDSRAQHESFRKELEAGGGRAAWSMSKQTEAGGAKVEISKPSSGTTLNAELDKFQAGGGKKTKKDVQIGGIAGRKDGKWHLGKKAGKG